MYNNKTFSDIWSEQSSFTSDLSQSYASNSISAERAVELYYLLYAEFGNSPIANNDENQFKYKVYSVIFRNAPTWQKRLEIQNILRNLREEEVVAGSKVVSNSANNPDGLPTVDGLQELIAVQTQSSSTSRRSKIEGYAMLNGLLQNDVTSEFVAKFRECFRQFVMPDQVDLYEEV